MAGRKDHKPSEVNQRLVVALKSCGVQQDTIAAIIGVSAPSLRKWYRAELDDGLARAVASAAANMFRLSLRQSHTGFCAARHVLNCHGGPMWRDVSKVELDHTGGEGLGGLMRQCGVDSDNAREIIRAKLDALAARNAAIDGQSCSAYKGPPGEEGEDG